MPYVRGPLQNNRIILKVGIRAFDDDPYGHQNFTFHEFNALADTGASRTAISQNVIDRVGLKPTGQIQVGNVKRTEMHSTFMFYVGIWPQAESDIPSGFFGIGEAIMGIDGGDSRYYDVLLGMDIITRGKLSTDFNREFCLEF